MQLPKGQNVSPLDFMFDSTHRKFILSNKVFVILILARVLSEKTTLMLLNI